MASFGYGIYSDFLLAWNGCAARAGSGSPWWQYFLRFVCKRVCPRFSKPSLPFSSRFSSRCRRGREARWEKEGAGMNPFWEVADFIRGLGREMRFGELSRAPLQLLRLELRGEALACDWIARPPDIWDADLRPHQRERNVSEQALRDAIRVRDLVFDALPEVESTVLRAFRSSAAREPPELIITGVATRDAPPVFRVSSLVMRAKLHGFHFEIKDGILQALRGNDNTIFEVMGEIHFQETTP